MFSIMAAADSLRLRFASSLLSVLPGPSEAHLATEWPELDAALPDQGFPKGVVELAAPLSLGGGTSIALAAVRAAQRRDARAWCAWIDSEGTLYGPGAARVGVDLDRLLVVRPPRSEIGRVAVKIAEARACEVIVVDAAPFVAPSRSSKRGLSSEVLIRKLSLAAKQGGATVLLLTDSLAPRAVPWAVALRLELGRAPGHLVVKVAKDQRGRVGGPKSIVPMKTRPIAPIWEEVG
jgi:recombination protein RecA